MINMFVFTTEKHESTFISKMHGQYCSILFSVGEDSLSSRIFLYMSLKYRYYSYIEVVGNYLVESCST